ncbi:Uncharacterized protein pbN1_05860 [Aromatoleum bremense]|nr:Uncharacterized protein pbN1_05860 [Aromatoleum bremense]
MAKRHPDTLDILWRHSFIRTTPMSYMPVHDGAQAQGMILPRPQRRRRSLHTPEFSS